MDLFTWFEVFIWNFVGMSGKLRRHSYKIENFCLKFQRFTRNLIFLFPGNFRTRDIQIEREILIFNQNYITWIICSKIGLFLVTSLSVSVAFVTFEQYSPYIKNGSRNSRNTWLNLYFGVGDMASFTFSTKRSWISDSSWDQKKFE